MRTAWAISVVGLVSACGGGSTSTTELRIAQNDVKTFDGTYVRGGDWARVVVRYTPGTTFYEITTSFQTTLAQHGTEHRTAVALDPRADSDHWVELTSRDPEYPVVKGLLAALLGSGAKAQPSIAEKGTTLYGAAYTAARVLGLVPQGDGRTRPVLWAYPGYDDPSLLPPELLGDGSSSGLGIQSAWDGIWGCCGPINCWDCVPIGTGNCGQWCAAGDHCNTWGHYGRCGNLCPWPDCPHGDSYDILSYGGADQYCFEHWGFY